MLHLQLSVHSAQMGLVRTESQSPKRSARSNFGEIPRSLQLFPISSSSSPLGPDLSTYVLNCQVTSGGTVTRPESSTSQETPHLRLADYTSTWTRVGLRDTIPVACVNGSGQESAKGRLEIVLPEISLEAKLSEMENY